MNVIDMKLFTADGKPFVVYVVPDTEASINDADCYSPADIKAFNNDEWHFIGLIVRDEKDNEASLWGVEFGDSAEWSVTLETLMAEDYFVPALVREIGEMK